VKITLAERFLLLRRRMRITQSELGHLLEVSRRTINRREKDRAKTRQATVARFMILEGRNKQSAKNGKAGKENL
jgi:DNA-binding XRE family transcriptional regulator